MSRTLVGLLACFVLAVAGLAWGALTVSYPGRPAPRPGHQVIFYTEPPLAEVTQDRVTDPHDHTVLALSNRDAVNFPEPIDTTRDYRFMFRKGGFLPDPVSIPGHQLQQGVWPDPGQPSHRLKPNGAGAWLGYLWERRRPQVILVVLGGAGAFACFAQLAAEARRKRRLEKYQAAAGNDPHVGKLIADYRVVEYIAEGGFGAVYRALPAATLDERRSMAIKIMKLPDELLRKRFDREMRLCSTLAHPNIVRVLDFGETGDHHYVVMEYVPGRSLKSVIQEGRLEPDRLRAVFKQVAAALAHAHGQGVVHRDLKPDNVRVTDSYTVKLLDFGLARQPDKDGITQTGEALGTPAYMAPEQLSDSSRPTPAVDQYAFGLMVYEALSGELPYETDDDLMAFLTKRIQTGFAFTPLERKRPDLDVRLCRAVNRMLDLDPARRFPTIEEAFRAFEEAMPEDGDIAGTRS